MGIVSSKAIRPPNRIIRVTKNGLNFKASRDRQCQPLDTLSKINFLDLPGELRNQIYRLYLVSDEHIAISADLQLPALLAVNHRVRAETLSIFHLENEFFIPINSCNSTLYRAYFKNNILPHQQSDAVMGEWQAWIFLVEFDWENLVAWSRAVWKGDLEAVVGESLVMNMSEDTGIEEERTMLKQKALIEGATGMASECRALEWEDVEMRLLGLYKVAECATELQKERWFR